MIEYRFDLDLSQREMLRYYQGRARQVHVRTLEGMRVQFPAQILRRYVTRTGVQGRFRIRVDANRRLHTIERIA